MVSALDRCPARATPVRFGANFPSLLSSDQPPKTLAACDRPWTVDMHDLVQTQVRPTRPTRLAYAAAVLFRVVTARGWRAETAASDLRIRLHDDRALLRLLQARVARAMLVRPTETDERAHATLALALAGIGGGGSYE